MVTILSISHPVLMLVLVLVPALVTTAAAVVTVEPWVRAQVMLQPVRLVLPVVVAPVVLVPVVLAARAVLVLVLVVAPLRQM